MKWITRERPKIDHIACPWLIARFIDKEPESLHAPNPDIMKIAGDTGATPCDVPGVEFTHVSELCSFDALLNKYQLTDPALQQLAEIVRRGGISRLDLPSQSPRSYAISLELPRTFPNDHEMSKHGMTM